MPMMITFHAGRLALIAVLATLAAGCSREEQGWRSAEAADPHEAYGRFVEQHPDSELAAQARARLAQLAEERDWVQAGKGAPHDAYPAVPGRAPEREMVRGSAHPHRGLRSWVRAAPCAADTGTARGFASGAFRRARVAARDREGAARRARQRLGTCGGRAAHPGRARAGSAGARPQHGRRDGWPFVQRAAWRVRDRSERSPRMAAAARANLRA